uniref:Putative RNA-directed DNA polymerase (Reverse transcriptase) n=1 Tax=Malus domestica TaxID=3750 RepID=E4Z8N5_MALDO|nr:putative RNA-directed DNA polymerase (Reverse transcriptase) [Malus domestica]
MQGAEVVKIFESDDEGLMQEPDIVKIRFNFHWMLKFKTFLQNFGIVTLVLILKINSECVLGLEQVFVHDFKKHFSCDSPPSDAYLSNLADITQPCVSNHHNESLLSLVTDEEIWDAVSSIGALKALGLDGLSVAFFHGCWDQIKGSVSCLVKDFFQNGSSLRLINHTNITLVPKIYNPENVSNYKPISLCNVGYKIFTKIIIKRLKPLLDLCISQNQGVFAPGIANQDNILIAHEMFADFNRMKGRTGAMGVKLDLEKAYD